MSQKKPRRRVLPPHDPQRYAPSPAHPVRAKARLMAHDMDIQPHQHDWGQLVLSMAGAVRVEAEQAGQTHAFIVPPARAVWIPAGVVHAVRAIEQAELRTAYLHAGCSLAATRGFERCRVLEVSPLLRELLRELTPLSEPDAPSDPREPLLVALLVAELQRAAPVALGLALPQDKRLRRVCEALLEQPQQDQELRHWAGEVGASERTLARLFRQELGTSYRHWRQQLLLAQALSLAARKRPLASIAAELGYANPSAFSAMVKRTVGMSPREFFALA